MYKVLALVCFVALVGQTKAQDKDKKEGGSSGLPGMSQISSMSGSGIPGLGAFANSGSSSAAGGGGSSSSSSSSSAVGGFPMPGGANNIAERARLAHNAAKFFSDPCTIRTMRGFALLAREAQGVNAGSSEQQH